MSADNERDKINTILNKNYNKVVDWKFDFYYFCFVEKLVGHISYLIARHDCVIIPGFGAFLAEEVPACYNTEEQIFMPPCRTMRFNPKVIADDALLISEYIDREQLSYDEASRLMNRNIATLRNELSQNSIVRFGELGTFYMNINGNISFEVDANGIDDAYNFGFEPFAIPQLRNCEEKNIVIKRRDLGKYIATAAAIILTFIFVTPMSDSAFKQNMQASFTGFASNEHISLMQQVSAPAPAPAVNIVENCEISPIDANGNMEILHIEEPAEEVALETPATAPTAPATIENRKIYHIIVASSPNEDNAQLAIEELSAKMQAEYTVVKGGGRHRISIGQYESNNEATVAIKELKATFPDAWILQTTAR